MRTPLTLTEVSDAASQISDIYAGKYGIARDDDWFLLKLQEELGELAQAHLRLSSRGSACCCSTAAGSASTRRRRCAGSG